MKAILINAETRQIEMVSIEDEGSIRALIGFDTVISDEIDANGDRLFLDEECFIRGSSGRFRVDNIAPVAGKGLVVGSTDSGAQLLDVISSVEELAQRITWID